MTKVKTITRYNAAALMGKSIKTLDKYVVRKAVVRVAPGVYTLESVLKLKHALSEKKDSKKRAVLNAVIKHYLKHGEAPTIREIQEAAELSSSSLVNTYLRLLAKEGVGEKRKGTFLLRGVRQAVIDHVREHFK